MVIRRLAPTCLAALLSLAAGQGSAATLPEGFQESAVISGLLNPTAIRFAANGQVFVAEKSGMILVYDGIGDATPTPVVDLRTQVHNFWDRGLLGLAIDPGFPARPYLYALYTHDAMPGGTAPRWGTAGATSDPCPTPPGPTADGCVVQGRLSRIDVNPITMAGSEVPLLDGNWCQQYPSHSVGDLVFGADGMLYASAGDGASFGFVDWGQDGSPVNPCADPGGASPTPPSSEGGALRSQDIRTSADPTSYDGTVLRIDVGVPASGAQVPSDNPLRNNGVAGDDFVIAHGLRNPFRLAARPGTDEIWIAEVGWNDWEEINRITDPNDAVVENFGWPCFEGGNGSSLRQGGYDGANLNLCESLYANPVANLGGGATSVVAAPHFGYRHSEQVVPGELCGTGSSSATGAAFYTNGDYPSGYDGAFFFADSSRRCVWTLFPGTGGTPDPALRAPFVSNATGRVVDVQVGPGGDLFYVDFDGGNVFRVEYFSANEPPTALPAATPTSGDAPLLVQLDGSASSDPEDGASLLYAWDLDGDGAFDDSTLAAPSHTFVEAGSHLVRLRVTDSQGASDVASLTITADNTPPLVEIFSPSPDLLWAVGDEIPFSGRAVDPQDGLLPPESLSWTVIMHHCATLVDCHTHPVQDLPGVAAGEFVAPDHEYPSHLELRLTASDFGVGGWWDPAWTRRQRLGFDNTGQGEDLDGFPVLVRLDPTRIDYGQVAAGGADLRFVDADGVTPLPHEIESWNEAGVSTVWVRVPRIDGGSGDDHVWLYYGNAGAPPAQDAAGVWAGYAGVWHLGASLQDSSGNGNHGANSGTSVVPGLLGDARRFGGASWVDAGSGASLALTGSLTLEAWIAIDDPAQAGAPRVLSKKPGWDAAQGYNLEYKPAENNLTTVGSGGDYARADGIDLDTAWHWVGASVSGTSGRMYVDGVDRTSDGTLSALAAGAQSLRFGRESAEFFLGRIDEIRIAPLARSADWMAAQYLSMSDAFVEFGVAEDRGALSASATVEVHPAVVSLRFNTFPNGLQLGVGAGLATAPIQRQVIVGSTQSLSAPSPQLVDGVSREFLLWSDGGAQSHNIVAPETWQSFTAFYALPECADGVDNDADGDVDHPDDPGCLGALGYREGPECDNGLDDDGDGLVDWDGGPGGTPDAQCAGNPQRLTERPGCGLGFELAFLLPWLQLARRTRRARTAP